MNKLSLLTKSLLLSVLTLLFSFAVSSVAFTQEVMPVGDALKQFYELFSSLESKSGIALAFVIVQGLMLLMKTRLAQYTGKVRLTIVALLSLAVSILSGLVSGSGMGDILSNGATLSAISVAINQAYKQFFIKKD